MLPCFVDHEHQKDLVLSRCEQRLDEEPVEVIRRAVLEAFARVARELLGRPARAPDERLDSPLERRQILAVDVVELEVVLAILRPVDRRDEQFAVLRREVLELRARSPATCRTFERGPSEARRPCPRARPSRRNHPSIRRAWFPPWRSRRTHAEEKHRAQHAEHAQLDGGSRRGRKANSGLQSRVSRYLPELRSWPSHHRLRRRRIQTQESSRRK